MLAALLPLAWLLANHHHPWLSAWQEGLALALLALAGLLVRRDGRLPRAWAAVALLVLASVAGQWATGQLLFAGDALMVALYVCAFVGALALGTGLVAQGHAEGRIALDLFAAGLLVGAAVSVLVALAQWAGGPSLPFFTVDLARGARPCSQDRGQESHAVDCLGRAAGEQAGRFT